jgi:hypothetical protein
MPRSLFKNQNFIGYLVGIGVAEVEIFSFVLGSGVDLQSYQDSDMDPPVGRATIVDFLINFYTFCVNSFDNQYWKPREQDSEGLRTVRPGLQPTEICHSDTFWRSGIS